MIKYVASIYSDGYYCHSWQEEFDTKEQAESALFCEFRHLTTSEIRSLRKTYNACGVVYIEVLKRTFEGLDYQEDATEVTIADYTVELLQD